MKFYNFLQNQSSPVIINEWEVENFESLDGQDTALLHQDSKDKKSSPFFILFLAFVSVLIAVMIYLSF